MGGIVEILMFITFAFAVGFAVLVGQSIEIAYLVKSTSGWLKAVGFFLIGALQVWGFIRLPIAIMEAQSKGVLPASLTAEQWIRIALGFTALGFLIAGFHRLRQDLRDLGMN